MNLFKKSSIKISLLFFILGIIFISANKANAAIPITVTADSESVVTGTGTTIRWNAPGANVCVRSDTGASVPAPSGSFSTGSLTASKTFSITCRYMCPQLSSVKLISSTIEYATPIGSNKDPLPPKISIKKFEIESFKSGDIFTFTSGSRSVSVTAVSGDTVSSMASKLSSAINKGFVGVTLTSATSSSNILTVKSPVADPFTGTYANVASVSCPSPSISSKPATISGVKKIQLFTVSNNVAPGNVFAFTVSSETISITAISGDTPKSIADRLSANINGAQIGEIKSFTYSDLPGTFGVSGFITRTFNASVSDGTTGTNSVTITVTPAVTYTVSTSAGEGGTISPTSRVVNSGAKTDFSIIPNSGYSINTVTGCNGTLANTSGGYVYTTGAITSACTVIAKFESPYYTATAFVADGAGGTISPISRTVSSGESTTFTVTPSSKYATINSVTGCSGSLSDSTYTTGTMTKDCDVIATFMSGSFDSSSYSCIIPSGKSSCDVDVYWRMNNPIGTPTAITASGMKDVNVSNSLSAHQFGTVFSLPVPYDSRTFYLYNNAVELASVVATASCVSGTAWNGTICATAYTVSTSVIGGGTVNPTSDMVFYDSNTTFSIIPNDRYSISTVTGCNGTLSSNSQGYLYTTGAIRANCTVTATFITSPVTYTVSTSAGPGGRIEPSSRTVNSGEVTSFSVFANPGYSINTITGCGGSMTDEMTYTTGAITSDCTVTATFSRSGSMSGTLTPSSSSCDIKLGQSSCDVNLSWGIVNPVTVPTAITASGMPNINVTSSLITPQSGIRSVEVPYNSRTFYLYNNAVELASAKVDSDCEIGTKWDSDSNTCEEDTSIEMSGSLLPSLSSCPITSGGSCNINLSWNIVNPEETPTAITTSGMPDINVTSSLISPQSGVQSLTVPYTGPSDPRTFYLYNNAKELASALVTANCPVGTAWDDATSRCIEVPSGPVDCDVIVDCGACDQNSCKEQCTRTFIPPSNGGDPCPPLPPSFERTCYVGLCGGNGALNIEFKASPEKIFKGRSSVLTWSTNENADSCTSPDFDTKGETNSNNIPPVIVSPTSNTTYTLSCTGSTATEEKTTEIKVNSISVIEL